MEHLCLCPRRCLRQCLLIFATLLFLSNGEDFHPERTLLIDYYPQSTTTHPVNFLFRGNMPVVNKTFAYKEILQTMSAIIVKEHNFTLPHNFTLIVVSYLNKFEHSDLNIEKDFFKSNPHLGQFYNRVIVGSVWGPPQNETNLIKDIVKLHTESSIDQLPALMTFLREQLTRTGPVLIYSHCEAGTDRTGEVSGSYYMKYLNMTFTEALSIDNHVQSRPMKTMSRNALQWYCYYLRFIKGYQTLHCLP